MLLLYSFFFLYDSFSTQFVRFFVCLLFSFLYISFFCVCLSSSVVVILFFSSYYLSYYYYIRNVEQRTSVYKMLIILNFIDECVVQLYTQQYSFFILQYIAEYVCGYVLYSSLFFYHLFIFFYFFEFCVVMLAVLSLFFFVAFIFSSSLTDSLIYFRVKNSFLPHNILYSTPLQEKKR